MAHENALSVQLGLEKQVHILKKAIEKTAQERRQERDGICDAVAKDFASRGLPVPSNLAPTNLGTYGSPRPKGLLLMKSRVRAFVTVPRIRHLDPTDKGAGKAGER